jgi:hypothetical protein
MSKAAKARISDDMKVVVLKKENPFSEGTEIFKRAAHILASHGKSVEVAKKGRDGSIIRWLVDRKYVRVEAAK